MSQPKKNNTSKLRFAAIRRVSTEQQDKKGESLLTQRTEIEKTVHHLDGVIVEWYGGQEHATPGYEKKEIDRLLNDAQKNKFDAVIVTDADRWSRDNSKSSTGLSLFKELNIKFFVGTKEWDLYNPEHCLYLGMSAVMGQFYASNQKRKSLLNRIHRANRGIPTGGKLPFGRTFDNRTEQWIVDKEKQTIIQNIANRYLAGEKLPDLAEEFKMNHSNLHKILNLRSGNSWTLEFNSPELNISEKIKMKVPRLLSDDIIKAIRKKAEANKTYEHGKIKNTYLFSRMIFCKHCGYTMFGQTNKNEHRYYRHAHSKRKRKCKIHKTWINADEIENIVTRFLFECFGNPKAVQTAIERATPNLEKIKEAQKRITILEDELSKIKLGRDKILRFISSGTITENNAENELARLNQKESKTIADIQQLNDNISNYPTPSKIAEMAKKVPSKMRKHLLTGQVSKWVAANKPYEKMTHEEKTSLLKLVFSGKMSDGKRMGVYIEWNENGWKFDIHGHLIDEEGLIPEKERFIDSERGGARQQALVTKSGWYLRGKGLRECRFLAGNLQFGR
ncbi:MAG: hypothetical protein BWY69_01130 [Planctomycetes bacterium ADurb.Bin401]|nr:MAG: hypothetical protein BWY69_01130 [Planctomycetes bacterium ADurb.Bin401]